MAHYEYDAFISFAVEDKSEIVNDLCSALEENGLKIWFSSHQLTVGKSIEDTVRIGLSKSRFGIVVLTPNYFNTQWTQKELGALWSLEGKGQKVLPVLHNITLQELSAYDVALAGRWSLNTIDGIEHVARELSEVIKSKKNGKYPTWSIGVSILLFAILLGFLLWNNLSQNGPSDTKVKETIESRIQTFQSNLEERLTTTLKLENGISVDSSVVIEGTKMYDALETQYRNYYEFTNGVTTLFFKKNVAPATQIDFDNWQATDDYGFEHPKIYLVEKKEPKPYFDKEFIYFNTQPTTYLIESISTTDTTFIVTVTYSEPIRLASFHYQYSKKTDLRKHTTYEIEGFLPKEDYTFNKDSKGWKFRSVDSDK